MFEGDGTIGNPYVRSNKRTQTPKTPKPEPASARSIDRFPNRKQFHVFGERVFHFNRIATEPSLSVMPLDSKACLLFSLELELELAWPNNKTTRHKECIAEDGHHPVLHHRISLETADDDPEKPTDTSVSGFERVSLSCHAAAEVSCYRIGVLGTADLSLFASVR